MHKHTLAVVSNIAWQYGHAWAIELQLLHLKTREKPTLTRAKQSWIGGEQRWRSSRRKKRKHADRRREKNTRNGRERGETNYRRMWQLSIWIWLKYKFLVHLPFGKQGCVLQVVQLDILVVVHDKTSWMHKMWVTGGANRGNSFSCPETWGSSSVQIFWDIVNLKGIRNLCREIVNSMWQICAIEASIYASHCCEHGWM